MKGIREDRRDAQGRENSVLLGQLLAEAGLDQRDQGFERLGAFVPSRRDEKLRAGSAASIMRPMMDCRRPSGRHA